MFLAATTLSSCSSRPAPFDHPTSPGGQCIPLAGLPLDRAWVVPTDAQLYGAAHGYPPQQAGSSAANAERIVGNLHRACAELSDTPRGDPIDVVASR